MRALLPTIKERKRYILIKVTAREVKKGEVREACTQAGLQFLGELGMAKAGFQFLPETWNSASQSAIIRVGHKYVDHAKASLALIKQIGGKKAKIDSLKVSGTINTLKKDQGGLV